jgi:hypothetical protein
MTIEIKKPLIKGLKYWTNDKLMIRKDFRDKVVNNI